VILYYNHRLKLDVVSVKVGPVKSPSLLLREENSVCWEVNIIEL